MKYCRKCKVLLNKDNWNISFPKKGKYICKECNRLEGRIYCKASKQECFEAYGGLICACCKVVFLIEFLTLDHTLNDGGKERKTNGNKLGNGIYTWLRKNGFPDKHRYQVLCWNCNMAKSCFGVCPHSLSIFVQVDR